MAPCFSLLLILKIPKGHLSLTDRLVLWFISNESLLMFCSVIYAVNKFEVNSIFDMSWLLKQAEDILNRVDQQTNAALHQENSKLPPKQNQVEFIPDIPTIPLTQPTINRIPPNRTTITPTRRTKKAEESDLFNYLNSPTPVNNNETKKPNRVNNKTRTTSSSSIPTDDLPLILSHNNNNKELVLVRYKSIFI